VLGFGAYGYPAVPGMLQSAVANPVQSQGLPVPWYAVYGNHDSMFMGTFRPDPALAAWAVGDRKAALGEALALNCLQGFTSDLSPIQTAFNAVRQQLGWMPGIMAVTPDPARRLLEKTQFMEAHLRSPSVPGPVGHATISGSMSTTGTGRVPATGRRPPAVREPFARTSVP